MSAYAYRITAQTVTARDENGNQVRIIEAPFWTKPSRDWWMALQGESTDWYGNSIRRLRGILARATAAGEKLLSKYEDEGVSLVMFSTKDKIDKYGYMTVYQLTSWLYRDEPDYGTPPKMLIVPDPKGGYYVMPFEKRLRDMLELKAAERTGMITL